MINSARLRLAASLAFIEGRAHFKNTPFFAVCKLVVIVVISQSASISQWYPDHIHIQLLKSRVQRASVMADSLSAKISVHLKRGVRLKQLCSKLL